MNEIPDILRHATDRLGASLPLREAEILLAHALGLEDRRGLRTLVQRPSAGEIERFEALMARRAASEPIQYILGYADFYEGRFEVGPGVFIPRPDTETLVDVFLKEWGDRARAGRFLELGTGSGAIVVSLLQALPNAEAIGIECSRAALRCTERNASRFGVRRRLRLIAGDLAEPLSAAAFDAIVSNPPYVATKDELPREVRDFEPAEALFAGSDGLDVLRRLVPMARRHVRDGGFVAVEIGASQREPVLALFTGAGFSAARAMRDLAGHERVVCAVTTAH